LCFPIRPFNSSSKTFIIGEEFELEPCKIGLKVPSCGSNWALYFQNNGTTVARQSLHSWLVISHIVCVVQSMVRTPDDKFARTSWKSLAACFR
jgi:hypothetical protein